MKFRPLILVPMALVLTAACNKVAKLDTEPKQKTLYSVGGTATINVKASDSKGKPVDKPKIEWTTANEKVVKVSAAGELTAVGAGQATVTAKSGSVSAEVAVRVVPLASIKLSPESINLVGPLGSTVAVQPNMVDDKGASVDEKVKWSSTAPSVATVSADGVVTSKGSGRTTIVAALDGVKAEAPVVVDVREIVKIVIHPETTILRVNETQAFSATVFDQNSTAIPNAAVVWKSNNPAVASVDLNGIVKAHVKGTCQITATFGGKSAESTAIVN